MAEYGYRPSYVGYVPKPINDLERVFDAFEVLRENYDGEDCKIFQKEFSKKLEDNQIKYGTGGPMASRNWFSTFKYFGFAYVGKTDNKIHITEVGKLIKRENRQEVIIDQLLKLQYPNPYQDRFIKGVNLYPFRVILRMLLKLPENTISKEEFGLFLMGLKKCSESDLTILAQSILDYRNSNYNKKESIRNKILQDYANSVITEFKKKNKNLKDITKERVWSIVNDYSSRHFLTLEYTGLCDNIKKDHTLKIPNNKVLLVRRIIHNKPLTIQHRFNNEEEWFFYYGSPTFQKSNIKQKVLSKKRYKLNQMLSVAENMKSKGRIDIKRLSETYNIPIKDVIKELRDYGYSKNIEEQTKHNEVIYKLAKLCKKKGFKPHVGEIEQGLDEKLRKISIPMVTNDFGLPNSVFKELKLIDLTWLKGDTIQKAIEVEGSEVDREINKFRNLLTTLSIPIELILIVPKKHKNKAIKKLYSAANKKEGTDKKIRIYTYEDVLESKLKL